MALKSKLTPTSDEFYFGLCFQDNILLAELFWAADITPPEEEHPRLSKEQKVMFSDESKQILFCTGRKLSKCVAGDTIIYDAITGHKLTAKEIFDNDLHPRIPTLNSDWRIVPSQPILSCENGIKTIYEVKSRSGLKIKVTGNHPFLSRDGWKNCDDLKIGDFVAIANNPLAPNQCVTWDSIERIEECGQEQTYDIQVDDTHNFVANGFIVHNSLILEVHLLRKALNTPMSTRVTEAMVVASREKIMSLLHGRIVARLEQIPVINCLINVNSSGEDMRLGFINNFVWYFRIEGLMGRDTNMTGLRAAHIIGDEMQESNMICWNSRKMTALPSCTILYCGVPNGIRSTPFYMTDKTDMGEKWSRHKYPSWINPLFESDSERKRLIRDYGGENTPAYQTQVLGEWGEEAVSSFPPGTIAQRDELPVFVKEYRKDVIAPYCMTNNLGALLALPIRRCHEYAVGIDYGIISDPTTMVFAVRDTRDSPWVEHLRIVIHNLELPNQIKVIKYICDTYFRGTCVGISSDHASILQDLQFAFGEADYRNNVVYNANPGGMSQVGVDADGKKIFAGNKQVLKETLVKYMINAQMGLDPPHLWLGKDDDLVDELMGITEKKTQRYIIYTGQSAWGLGSSAKRDHNFNAMLFLAHSITCAAKSGSDNHTFDEMIEACGWGGTPVTDFKMPWDG